MSTLSAGPQRSGPATIRADRVEEFFRVSQQSGEVDTDLRRRAAWLLAMLVVVAVLVVVVFTTLLGTDKGSSGDAGPVGPGAITSTGPATDQPTPSGVRTSPRATTSGPATTGASTSPSAPATGGPTSCPTSAACVLSTDVGNAVAAINAIRVQGGQKAVPGSVSAAAQSCALSRGNTCTGGWAETEVPAPLDGALAVKKISQFGKFLDPQLKSIAVGWAYDPGSKTYYFATIRQD